MSNKDDEIEQWADDHEIVDSVHLFRRIPPLHLHRDPQTGELRPSSAAFEDSAEKGPMSVYRSDVIELGEGGPKRVMEGHEGFGLVFLTAGAFRSKGQNIVADPLPDEPAHALAFGRKTRATRRWFA